MNRMDRNDDSGDSHSTGESANQTSVNAPEQHEVEEAVQALMEELDIAQHCEVDVSVDGKWCTFEGTVDSQEIRTALFDIVPSQNGRRFIVDRLQVTYDITPVEDISQQ